MNTDLDIAIATLINKSLEGVDASVAFLQAEIPDYVYQLLLWYGVKNAITGIIALLITIVWIKYLLIKPINIIREGKREVKRTMFTYSDGDVKEGAAFLIFNLFAFVPFTIGVTDLLLALKIYIAPKVWLLEYASALVK
jgi:hypothetical protein